MDANINRYIDDNREEMIATLMELIETPSPDLGPTTAQRLVQNKLDAMGFVTEAFPGDLDAVRSHPDYCEPGISYDTNAYNVAGKRKGTGDAPSLMLFAHIDTEAEDAFGKKEQPFLAERESGKIYGLGAADDKGGIAMMLEALKVALLFKPSLPYDLTVLSILGKHGGAYGTLTAMQRGYNAQNTIYLHPAETGHGFQEIKNISLGVVDLKLTLTGRPGIPHDDLSAGINANLWAGKAIGWLEEYDQHMRDTNLFDFGSFKGEPSFLLNIGSVQSDAGYGEVALKAEIRMRCRFYHPLTPQSVKEGLASFLGTKMQESGYTEDWTLEYGDMKATPAIVPNDHPFVNFVENCITEICGPMEFIHQYHAGSDIRFPMVFGGSHCIGIGPSCILPKRGTVGKEWIDEEDYITGIKILVEILLSYS